MLDFGWPELFLIIAVAVLVIGPDEIPNLMLGLGRVVRRLQYVKYAVSQQFEDMMRESDLDNIRRSVNFEAPDEEEMDEAGADQHIAALVDSKDTENKDRKDEGSDE